MIGRRGRVVFVGERAKRSTALDKTTQTDTDGHKLKKTVDSVRRDASVRMESGISLVGN